MIDFFQAFIPSLQSQKMKEGVKRNRFFALSISALNEMDSPKVTFDLGGHREMGWLKK